MVLPVFLQADRGCLVCTHCGHDMLHLYWLDLCIRFGWRYFSSWVFNEIKVYKLLLSWKLNLVLNYLKELCIFRIHDKANLKFGTPEIIISTFTIFVFILFEYHVFYIRSNCILFMQGRKPRSTTAEKRTVARSTIFITYVWIELWILSLRILVSIQKWIFDISHQIYGRKLVQFKCLSFFIF